MRQTIIIVNNSHQKLKNLWLTILNKRKYAKLWNSRSPTGTSTKRKLLARAITAVIIATTAQLKEATTNSIIIWKTLNLTLIKSEHTP